MARYYHTIILSLRTYAYRVEFQIQSKAVLYCNSKNWIKMQSIVKRLEHNMIYCTEIINGSISFDKIWLLIGSDI